MDLKYCKDGMRKNRVQGPQTDSEVKCYERRENPPRPWCPTGLAVTEDGVL